MKAIQFGQYGGPEVLELVDVDEPTAGPGQIRIAVRAAGVNSLDWKIRSGAMREHVARYASWTRSASSPGRPCWSAARPAASVRPSCRSPLIAAST